MSEHVRGNSNRQFTGFLFVDQGKQPSVFRFHMKQTEVCFFSFPLAANNGFPFSVSSVFRLPNSGDMETWTWRHEVLETKKHEDIDIRHGVIDMETWTWRHRHGDLEFLKIKRKTRKRFFFIRLPFAHRANGISSFDRLMMKK
jgi:hypothetical protein